jgi:hypothetical protein
MKFNTRIFVVGFGRLGVFSINLWKVGRRYWGKWGEGKLTDIGF